MHKERASVFGGPSWLYACVYLDRQILGILAQSITADLHLSDAQPGALTGSAFGIVYALIGLYCGGLADRVDRVILVRTGAWVWSMASIAMAFACSYARMIVVIALAPPAYSSPAHLSGPASLRSRAAPLSVG